MLTYNTGRKSPKCSCEHGGNYRCRAHFKGAQAVVGHRFAGNGPNGLYYDYYYYYCYYYYYYYTTTTTTTTTTTYNSLFPHTIRCSLYHITDNSDLFSDNSDLFSDNSDPFQIIVICGL